MPRRLTFEWQAFQELMTCRAMGQMVMGQIPWTAIHEYATAKKVVDHQRFEYLIRALDTAFLEHQTKPGIQKRHGQDPSAGN